MDFCFENLSCFNQFWVKLLDEPFHTAPSSKQSANFIYFSKNYPETNIYKHLQTEGVFIRMLAVIKKMTQRLLILSLGILLFISCSEVNNGNQNSKVKGDTIEILTLDQLSKFEMYSDVENLPVDKDSVLRLNLSEQQLTEIPSEVFNLTNLQELNISQNNLSELKGIEKLINLQILNIGMNDFEIFPLEITKLKNLKVLSIWWNKIKSFPQAFYEENRLIEQLDMTSMFEFDFENNLNQIHSFENLRQLNLGNNQTPNLTIQFDKLTNLEVFGYIRQESVNLKKLCQDLASCKNLKTVHFSVNNISVLPEEILLLENLEELNLYDNKLITLPESIVKMKKLKEISLIDNPINEQQIKKIEEQMPQTKIIY
jgi:Leucine-rich repeat (LRR) protein